MIAKDENGHVNEVPGIFESPGEFIDYTKRYFELNEYADKFVNHKSFPNPLYGLKCN